MPPSGPVCGFRVGQLGAAFATRIGHRIVSRWRWTFGGRSAVACAGAALSQRPRFGHSRWLRRAWIATEQLLEQALDTLLAGRTAIIIAHRLETVRRADLILSLAHDCRARVWAVCTTGCRSHSSHFASLLRTTAAHDQPLAARNLRSPLGAQLICKKRSPHDDAQTMTKPRYFWRMMGATPLLSLVVVLFNALHNGLPLLFGLILRAFFDTLSGVRRKLAGTCGRWSRSLWRHASLSKWPSWGRRAVRHISFRLSKLCCGAIFSALFCRAAAGALG